jgi:hypothetical protein
MVQFVLCFLWLVNNSVLSDGRTLLVPVTLVVTGRRNRWVRLQNISCVTGGVQLGVAHLALRRRCMCLAEFAVEVCPSWRSIKWHVGMYVCTSAVPRVVNSGTFVCVRCLNKVCCPVRQSGSRLKRREGIVRTVSDGVCFYSDRWCLQPYRNTVCASFYSVPFTCVTKLVENNQEICVLVISLLFIGKVKNNNMSLWPRIGDSLSYCALPISWGLTTFWVLFEDADYR